MNTEQTSKNTFMYKNIINGKMILFGAVLLAQKNMMLKGYAEQSIK